MDPKLPPIPAKRYFTIGEVGELCDVKPYVLRYWEREFAQLRPMKRRGNRRYYQHHEILMIRRIRDLLHVQGLSIDEARRQLQQTGRPAWEASEREVVATPGEWAPSVFAATPAGGTGARPWPEIAQELRAIRRLLAIDR